MCGNCKFVLKLVILIRKYHNSFNYLFFKIKLIHKIKKNKEYAIL